MIVQICTFYTWAFEFPSPQTLPTGFENNKEKLIDIVDTVQWCIGKEFRKDCDRFRQQNKRDPTDSERPYIHPPFDSYDAIRKQEFLNCIKKNIGQMIRIDNEYLLNISLRIWSGSLGTAKTLSLRTQTGRNTR